MSRRLKSVAAGLVVTGSLAGAALASAAATSTTPTTPTTPSAPPAGQQAPDGGHHHRGGKGDCPGMGGDSSSSAPSSEAPGSTGTGSV